MTHSCATCKFWNTDEFMRGCDKFCADTGEVLHYYENADKKCEDYEEDEYAPDEDAIYEITIPSDYGITWVAFTVIATLIILTLLIFYA